jgi:hypothetical protein
MHPIPAGGLFAGAQAIPKPSQQKLQVIALVPTTAIDWRRMSITASTPSAGETG